MTLKVTQGQLSIDIGCPRPNSTANLPHVAAAAGRRDTDGRTDGHSTVLRRLPDTVRKV